ncbi:MAG: undecaprenyldiphospho-muramoylpentapeptide beta-N-acetylglucosaminyltransferase [Gammaproteobacteria bacterium]|nr:undecaprenyldiphospho-muramoylpentapeptide beta-N-acetylglucosaminyltransferase [Gammaproteobacteria bacterium]
MTRAKQQPIVVMAGGTGGHVFPALAVAEYLRHNGESVVWLGTRAGIESRVVPAANIAIEWLSVQGLRGKGKLTLLLAPFRLIRACWQAYRALLRLRPKAVLGMGGFVSGPGGLMAWLLRIPLVLHEQNSVIGLTNKLLSRFASQSYFGFPAAARGVSRSEYIGNPVRAELFELESPESRLTKRLADNLNLLVIGGSLGAASLNRMVPLAVSMLDIDSRPNIKHQCGNKHLAACQQNYREAGVEAEVQDFINDMPSAYAWADLVVCRAGALTIAELTAVGVGSILIPYPYAVDNHQYHNARFLEENNAANILTEDDLNADRLAVLIQSHQQDREGLIAMAKRAQALANVNATEKLAQGILERVKA